MKIIWAIIIAVLSLSCSSSVEKIVSEDSKQDSIKIKKQKEFAKQLFIDAALLDLEGKYAEAILEYQEAIKLDPQAGIYYSIAKDYLRLNKLFPALENAKNAVKLEKNNKEYLTLLGTIYNLSRNADSAEAVFSQIVAIDSTDVGALYNLAQIYEPKQPLKALRSYKRILDITGSEWNVMLKIAELNERLGKVDETIMTVEDLLDLNPSNLELKKLLIESYIKNGKYQKALSQVNDALELFPDDLSLTELRGNTYVKMEKWNLGAIDYKNIISTKNVPFNTKLRIGTAFYSEALNDSSLIPYAEDVLLEVDKDSADWQINAFLGELANNRGDDSLTLHYFRRAIELAELNSDLRVRLGQILFENGKFETASVEMKKAVEKFPQSHVINLILGLSLAQNSNHEAALPYLRESVNLNPNDLNSNLAYSFSLNQTDNEEEAIKYLERTLRIDPKNVQALGMMGLIYDGKEMYSKSDSIYALAIAADSTDVMILNNFAYSLAERGIELEKALKMVKRAVDQEPENSSYLDTFGWVYYQLGEYESALNYIEKAIEFDPSNATLLDHLGDVYFRMGNSDKAIELWKESLLLDSSNTEIQTKIENGLD